MTSLKVGIPTLVSLFVKALIFLKAINTRQVDYAHLYAARGPFIQNGALGPSQNFRFLVLSYFEIWLSVLYLFKSISHPF